jgi:hypothetical protein
MSQEIIDKLLAEGRLLFSFAEGDSNEDFTRKHIESKGFLKAVKILQTITGTSTPDGGASEIQEDH